MPLYNNILSSNKDKGAATASDATAPNAAMKLLQDHLKRRAKQQQTAAPAPSNKKQASKTLTETNLARHPFETSWDPHDEYDPTMPNSYELLQAEYIKAEEQKLLARRASSGRFNADLLDVLDKLEEVEQQSCDTSKARGAAIAPPTSLARAVKDEAAADVVTAKTDHRAPAQTSGGASQEKLDGLSAAARIMSKMGYKAGQGLGRDQQGMCSPLEVETSGLNTGRIVQGGGGSAALLSSIQVENKRPAPVAVQQPQSKPQQEAGRVVLLQNMVGPGEVDEDLEAETKEECRKYGDVLKCLIYEIPNKRVADSEAVRIFVEFRTPEAANRAKEDLNGRYFGGRIVRASLYSLEHFRSYDLSQ